MLFQGQRFIIWRRVRAILISRSFIKETLCFFSVKSIRFKNTKPTLNFKVPAVSSLCLTPGINYCPLFHEIRLLCHFLCRIFCIEKVNCAVLALRPHGRQVF